ncbi:MAG TPA: TRAP transporter small permease [Burkholderiales bacterium]
MPEGPKPFIVVTVIEAIAAVFLAFITALTFVAVILRYVFSYAVADSYDIARLMLGVSIFWGIAAANYRDEHIGMDLVWSMVGKRGKWIIDVCAGLVTLAVFVVFAWMFTLKLGDTFRSGETTFDLHLPLWGFYALAWLGLVSGVVLLSLRMWRMILHPESVPEKAAEPLVMD